MPVLVELRKYFPYISCPNDFLFFVILVKQTEYNIDFKIPDSLVLTRLVEESLANLTRLAKVFKVR